MAPATSHGLEIEAFIYETKVNKQEGTLFYSIIVTLRGAVTADFDIDKRFSEFKALHQQMTTKCAKLFAESVLGNPNLKKRDLGAAFPGQKTIRRKLDPQSTFINKRRNDLNVYLNRICDAGICLSPQYLDLVGCFLDLPNKLSSEDWRTLQILSLDGGKMSNCKPQKKKKAKKPKKKKSKNVQNQQKPSAFKSSHSQSKVPDLYQWLDENHITERAPDLYSSLKANGITTRGDLFKYDAHDLRNLFTVFQLSNPCIDTILKAMKNEITREHSHSQRDHQYSNPHQIHRQPSAPYMMIDDNGHRVFSHKNGSSYSPQQAQAPMQPAQYQHQHQHQQQLPQLQQNAFQYHQSYSQHNQMNNQHQYYG